MKAPSLSQVCTSFIVGVLSTWLAGNAAGQTAGLAVSADNITRFGDTRDLDCAVELKFSGGLASNAVAITGIRVTQAVDDTGKDLSKAIGAFSLANDRQSMDGTGWKHSITLKCPVKSARMIRRLEEDVDLAVPTPENGGRLILEKFRARPGEAIPDAKLEGLGITLTFHTLESYFDFQRANPKQYVNPRDEAIEERCFSGIYGNPTDPPRTSVALKIEDPNKKLIGFAFEADDGSTIHPVKVFDAPPYRSFHFVKPPPEGLKLVVFVATPGVVQTRHFSLHDVLLPWVP